MADPDYTSQIPQVRALIGDADSQWFQDSDIETYLALQEGSSLRAAGLALQNMATNFAVKARSIKTDDLAIDTRARATGLLELAKEYFAQADALDARDATNIFQIVDGPCAPFDEPWPRPAVPGFLI